MKMDNPVIVFFDSDANYRTVLDLICYGFGLSGFHAAIGKEKANKLFKLIKSGEIKPDIAIMSDSISGNLSDGKKLAEAIKSINSEIKVINYSFSDEGDDWSDYFTRKGDSNGEGSIITLLEKLLGKEFNYSNAADNSQYDPEKG